MNVRKTSAVAALALLLTACSWKPKLKFWEEEYRFEPGPVKVNELRRALVCGTPTEDAVVRLFDDVAALKAWDSDDRLRLARIELPTDKAFVLVEQGLRRTGGYSIELRRNAELNEQGRLRLKADFLEPGPDRIVTQMLTSLCVLVAVEAHPYTRVELVDADDQLRAARDIARD